MRGWRRWLAAGVIAASIPAVAHVAHLPVVTVLAWYVGIAGFVVVLFMVAVIGLLILIGGPE